MLPRLALTAAAGALLVLGACSGGSSTVTRAPEPEPTPVVMLPAAAAALFTAGDKVTVLADEPNRDASGNRYREVNGHRFVCRGTEACTWTIVEDDDGDLVAQVEGDVAPRIAATPPPPPPPALPMPTLSDEAEQKLAAALANGESKTITVLPGETNRDANGNRYRDVDGARFVCRGAETCTWTVAKDDDGNLTVTGGGEMPLQIAATPPPPPPPALPMPTLSDEAEQKLAAALANGESKTITVLPGETNRDANGNRYRDVDGARFVCRGAETCTWTVAKDDDGNLTVTGGGEMPLQIAATPPPPPPPALPMPVPTDEAKQKLNAALEPGEPKRVTVSADETQRNANGHRFREVYGVLFVCQGDETCTWTITEAENGDLTIVGGGDVELQIAAAPTPPAPVPSGEAEKRLAAALEPGESKKVTVSADETRRDANGNRYRVVDGARFVCRGDEACTWTITKDADGNLTVVGDGDVDLQIAEVKQPTLPEAAKAEFTEARREITIRREDDRSPENLDANGNRYIDVNGYRFTCEGEGACSWTITRDGDGKLTIMTTGDVAEGEIHTVTPLNSAGIQKFLDPRSGEWDLFTLDSKASIVLNLVKLTCEGDEACQVQIQNNAEGRNLVWRGGGEPALERAQEFYDGLAYGSSDPIELSGDLGTALGTSDTSQAQWQTAGWESGLTVGAITTQSVTLAHIRNQPGEDEDKLSEDSATISNQWASRMSAGAEDGMEAIGHHVRVVATPSGSSGTFAGFKPGTPEDTQQNTYGAREAGVPKLMIELQADHVAANRPAAYSAGTLTWTAPINGGEPTAKSPTDMWMTGFSDIVRLGTDTAILTDDGTLHYQLLTNHDVDKVGAPYDGFGNHRTMAADTSVDIAGTVLIRGTSTVVPSAPTRTQSIGITRGVAGQFGTYNGVPGEFWCSGTSVTGCTVETAESGQQSLETAGAAGQLNFAPTTGAQVVGDTDWLAIGSWALAMDDGPTVFGAFVDHPAQLNDTPTLRSFAGLATYDGQARGHYAEFNSGARESGVFAAAAKFNADFGDATADGDIYGTLRSFTTTAHGGKPADRSAWRIDFASADEREEFNFGVDQNGFSLPLTGVWGPESDNRIVGETNFRFYRGPDVSTVLSTKATAIAGTFAATSGRNDDDYDLSLIGAVGATRVTP